MKISFTGLGIMGSRMAANLMKEYDDVTVHNRTKSKADELLKKGAKWADTPAEAAKEADIFITMLANPEAVEATAYGEAGFLKSLKKNSLWMDCSTVNPAFSERMYEESGKRGVRFMDAPVAGSLKPAESGDLLFLVGGSKQDLKEAEPLIKLMGRDYVHAGPHGKGSSLKMVVNLMLGMSMAAFGEAVNFGKSMGLNQETLFNTLVGGPLTAPYLKAKKENFEKNEYPVEFPLELMHKDLHLAATTAYEKRAPMFMANAAKELFSRANSKGLSREDFTALFKIFE